MRQVSLSRSQDIAIVIAYPDNWAKYHSAWSDRIYRWGISTNQYYKVGHAAILIISRNTGKVSYYDFGRYTTGANHGRVRSGETDPSLELITYASFDEIGELSNMEQIIHELDSKKKYTHGHGRIIFSICDRINAIKATRYADKCIDKGCIPYSPFVNDASNCSRFVANMIRVSSYNRSLQRAIRYPFTLSSTPIGNVVSCSSSRFMYLYENAKLTNIKISKWDEFRAILKKLFLSSFIKSKHLQESFEDYLSAPNKHFLVPSDAQWLGGLGEGAWISIRNYYYEPKYKNDNLYQVTRYDEKGSIVYRIIAQSTTKLLQSNKPYTIDNNSNRLKTVVVQDESVIVLSLFDPSLLMSKIRVIQR